MGLLSDSAAVLEDSPASSGSVDYGSMATQIPPEVQAARDAWRRKAIQAEIDGVTKWPDSNPNKATTLQALSIEARAMGDQPAPPTPTPARSQLLGAAIAALDDGGHAPIPFNEAPDETPMERATRRVGMITDMARGSGLDDAARASENRIPREPATMQLAKTILNQATGAGATIMGGWRGLAALASGATLDEAVRQVESPELAGGATARAYEGGSTMEQVASLPSKGLGYVGNKAGEVVADATGSPGAGAATNAGVQTLVPVGIAKGARAVAAQAARPAPRLVGSSSIADVAAGKPAAIGSPADNLDIPTVIRRRAAASTAPASPASTETRTLELAPQEGTPGRTASFDEKVAPVSAEEAKAAAPEFEAAEAPEQGSSLPVSEQQRRVRVLRSVGLADEDIRRSAVQGDAKAAAGDYQQSKVKNEAGDLVSGKLANERAVLTNNAEQLVRDTGGTLGTDSQALYGRGNTIVAPLQGLKDWFDSKTRALYAQADQRASGIAIETPRAHEFIGGDQADFMGTQEGEKLLGGIKSRMKSLGMTDEAGNAQPVTVQQAEQLKQYLNAQWAPRTARLIQGMKDALDDDVTSSAGEDLYKQARAMRAMRSAVFENDLKDAQGRTIPNGIGKIVDGSGKGIALNMPIEKVADAVTALPVDEFAHVVKTLQSVPAELQPQAQAALSEIKAHVANRVLEAGRGSDAPGAQWNARNVTATLNKSAAKLPLVFSPDEIARFKNLNDAGQILRVDTSYPGAAIQAQNLVQRGAIAALPKAAAAGGAALGSLLGPLGTVAGAIGGEVAGTRAAGAVSAKASVAAAKKRFVRLNEFPK